MWLQWFRANGLGLDSSRGAEFHRIVVAGGQRLRVAAASCIAFAATVPAFRRHGHPAGRGTGFRPPNRPEDCALLDNIVKNVSKHGCAESIGFCRDSSEEGYGEGTE